MGDLTLAEKLLRQYPRLSRFIGGASLATLVLGTIASFLGNLADLRRHLFELLGIENLILLHYAMSALAGLLFLVGYMFGGLWVYKRWAGSLSLAPRRLLAVMGVLIGLLLTIGTSYLAFPSVPDIHGSLGETADAWKTELLALEVQGGGLRTSQSDPEAPPQVWSTAQTLDAILARPVALSPEDAKRIREDFEFIERERLPGNEGWGYVRNVDWGVTEIAAWVALAYAASLEPHAGSLIWGADYPQLPRQRLSREIELVLQRQSPSGGWPPVNKAHSTRDNRTYSTVMAVWALAEARRWGAFDERSVSVGDVAIEKGIRWLLSTYAVELQSWVPNPGRPAQLETFPGLTAQVLYVLGRAKPYVAFLDGDANYVRARNAFLVPDTRVRAQQRDPRSRPVTSNDRTHDSDRYLSDSPRMVESSTFLWAPWSLAYCADSLGHALGDINVREATLTMCRTVTGRVNELTRFAKDEPFIYVMAETLLAINVYLQANGDASGKESAEGSSRGLAK
jgi:hypothetical protein